ncbi:hydroxyacid dehydrogenase [Rariglobus hedericola]|uniref:Hydroxyacid dehydrogenase n=1 Tax=Rariglobus hedericola TaxID=2597822 RepID=A0A556QRR6_9BACT|nr:hydroxyacid dehydrogenase [Rariglobus hedericola]TSJ79335.1 hydroxyacid dehydrogenase [Rariglobus hedericola]
MHVLPQVDSSPSLPRTKRVFFALNDYERRVFFPEYLAAELDALNGEAHWRTDELPSPAYWQTMMQELQPDVIVSCWSTPAVPFSLANAGSPLAYVCHLVGSVRNLVPRTFLERGGLLTNWGDIAGKTVAEHALLLALAALRNQPGWRPIINGPKAVPWRSGTMRLQPRSLYGRRVGIHGFGHVARALIRLLQPFDVEISAYSAGVPTGLMRSAGVTPFTSLLELATRSEVFFDCEALTPQSTASINATVLAALPDDAVFVNVGRGPVVDEPALVREAASGRIQVALDVVCKEPIDPASPLASLPGVILSPHIGGPTFDHFPHCGQRALENLARYLRGESPEALITPELYDRST